MTIAVLTLNIKLSTKQLIETYLLERGDWVPTAEICETFGVEARQLRQVGSKNGLCTDLAISGDKGFKHVANASTSEWLRFKHRLRHHGISELVRVRDLDRLRSQLIRTVKIKTPPPAAKPEPRIFERDTGQALLFAPPISKAAHS